MTEKSHHIKIVEDYLDTFEARNLDQCLEFFERDAVLHFASGRFPGLDSIRQWHQDRFKGGMRITEIEHVEEKGDTVIMHAVATSPRLKLVRIKDFRGIGTFVFNGDRFKEVRMGLRTGYRFHI